MCGRYGLIHSGKDIAERFYIRELGEDGWEVRYNVAPTETMPVILAQGGERVIQRMRWGLVPFWAKDLKVGASMINARVRASRTNRRSGPPYSNDGA